MFAPLVLMPVGIVLLLIISGFFYASKFSLLNAPATFNYEVARQGSPTARLIQWELQHPGTTYLGSMLGIILSTLALGWLWGSFSFHVAGLFNLIIMPLWYIIFTVLSFILLFFIYMFLGNIIPKSYALLRSEQTIWFIARPFHWYLTLIQPISKSVRRFGELFTRWPTDQEVVGTLQQLPSGSSAAHIVREPSQHHPREAIVLKEDQLIYHLLTLRYKTLRHVMRHRDEIAALPLISSFEEVKEAFLHFNYTRIVIYEETLDTVIGVLHLQDFYRWMCQAQPNQPFSLLSLIQPIPQLRQKMHVINALSLLESPSDRPVQLAIVQDNYGLTCGLLTLADICNAITTVR